jgi:hypothetical protein
MKNINSARNTGTSTGSMNPTLFLPSPATHKTNPNKRNTTPPRDFEKNSTPEARIESITPTKAPRKSFPDDKSCMIRAALTIVAERRRLDVWFRLGKKPKQGCVSGSCSKNL